MPTAILATMCRPPAAPPIAKIKTTEKVGSSQRETRILIHSSTAVQRRGRFYGVVPLAWANVLTPEQSREDGPITCDRRLEFLRRAPAPDRAGITLVAPNPYRNAKSVRWARPAALKTGSRSSLAVVFLPVFGPLSRPQWAANPLSSAVFYFGRKRPKCASVRRDLGGRAPQKNGLPLGTRPVRVALRRGLPNHLGSGVPIIFHSFDGRRLARRHRRSPR